MRQKWKYRSSMRRLECVRPPFPSGRSRCFRARAADPRAVSTSDNRDGLVHRPTINAVTMASSLAWKTKGPSATAFTTPATGWRPTAFPLSSCRSGECPEGRFGGIHEDRRRRGRRRRIARNGMGVVGEVLHLWRIPDQALHRRYDLWVSSRARSMARQITHQSAVTWIRDGPAACSRCVSPACVVVI